MRFNDRQLCIVANEVPDLEDRLSIKKKSTSSSFKKEVFKQRLFRLKYNMLFSFKIGDTGQISEEPDGVIFLVDCLAKVDHDGGAPFAFSLTFGGTNDKILIFAARDENALFRWISAINNASYAKLKQRMNQLQFKLGVF